MKTSKWRIAARRAIGLCIQQEQPQTAKEFKRAARSYYPFYERKYHPYKMWLSEVNAAAERIEHARTPEHLRNYWLNPPLKKG